MTETIHATTVAIAGRGVLIEGPSGAGKSNLALRLIDRGATLVADDRTAVARDGDAAVASAPATIAGLIEVRGLGIVRRPFVARAPLAIAVAQGTPARMPEPATRTILGVPLPQVTVDARAPGAAITVELALKTLA